MSFGSLRGLWWPALMLAAVLVSGLALGRGFANLHNLQEELKQVRQTNQRLDQENRAMYRLALRLRPPGLVRTGDGYPPRSSCPCPRRRACRSSARHTVLNRIPGSEMAQKT